jgi:hypothetical protein
MIPAESNIYDFGPKMSNGGENEEEDWFRPPWETEEEIDPPGIRPRVRKPPSEPDYGHPLLTPLARAQTEFEMAPSDILVNESLQLARLWRRIAELRSWRPLEDAGALRESLRALGCGALDDTEIADWFGIIRGLDRGPVLIRAGRAARDWLNRPGVEGHNPAAFFVAACLWRKETTHSPIPLPVWSAPELYHHRLGLRIGVDWMAQFLECVTAAAVTGLRELAGLLAAEKKREDLGGTARSRLPEALDAVLRTPVVTADSLAKILHVTPRAALGLLQQLMAASLVREATGRASWRAYSLALYSS